MIKVHMYMCLQIKNLDYELTIVSSDCSLIISSIFNVYKRNYLIYRCISQTLYIVGLSCAELELGLLGLLAQNLNLSYWMHY
jgi:hypothetical protein